MNTSTERKYISDSESYAVFVGSITPAEFVAGYDTHAEAVDDLIENWQFPDENPPSWLRESLLEYLWHNA